jgi:hypothetical protein
MGDGRRGRSGGRERRRYNDVREVCRTRELAVECRRSLRQQLLALRIEAGVGPVPTQMWQEQANYRCRYGRGGPSPSADVAGVRSVPVQR